MLNKILVPLDGSALAEVALPHAKAIANRVSGTLVLVRAAHYTSLFPDVAVDQARVITQAEDYLNRLAVALRDDGLSVETAAPFGGSTVEWITEEAGIRHADLIVMATHARVGPDRWRHGSVAEAVVHRSSVPVMLVRATGAAESRTSFEAGLKLIVPLDGSHLAEAALPVCRELAEAFGAPTVLLAVVPKPGQLVAGQGGAIVTYTGSEHAELEASARAYLESVVERLGGTAVGLETAIKYGDPGETIAAASDEYAAAAIVMATHGRTGVLRSVLGSVAGGVLLHSSRPVVLVHPSGSKSKEQQAALQAAGH